MTSLSYAVIGTGAVGGLYGGKLAHGHKDVHFLLNSDYQYVQEHGLQVDSVDGNFKILPIQAYGDYHTLPSVDVFIVALKSTQNTLLIQMLGEIYRPGQTVLLLQNGLGVEEELSASIPGIHLLGGLCFICSNKIGPGHIDHLDYGSVMLGEYQPTGQVQVLSNRFKQIVHDFQGSGIVVNVSEDLALARWKKLVWNMPFNGLAVLYGDTAQIMSQPDARQWARQIMLEVLAAARANGQVIPESFIDEMLTNTDLMKPYKPSMQLDALNGRPLELKYIYQEPIRRGIAAGVAMPYSQALLQRLSEVH